MLWQIYLWINGVIILFYIWYRTILLFISDIFEKRYPPLNKPFTVVIPIYNEDRNLLKECIKSVFLAKGEKEIIIVDDGSTKLETINFLNKLESVIDSKRGINQKVKILRLKENVGKRGAHKEGFLAAKYDILVVVDSDTIIEKEAFVNLIAPFNDSKVGATTGEIKPLNERENMITKTQAAVYLTGLGIDRKSQSFYGIVTCCSGALSAYRKELVMDYLDEYTNQYFWGEKCNSGDDRYLTNLILRNWRVKYVKESIAYTNVPNTFRKWVKQLLRWKRSFIRESLICIENSWRKKNLLFFETLLNLFLPIIFVFIRVAFILSLIFYPVMWILFIPSVLIMTFIRNSTLFFEQPKRMVYSFVYSFYYNFVFYWLYFIALFTLKNTKWGTR